jgi:hypothetical protein
MTRIYHSVILNANWNHNASGRAQKHIAVIEVSADIIGITAGRHGKIRVFLEDNDFSIVVDSSGFRCRFGTGG